MKKILVALLSLVVIASAFSGVLTASAAVTRPALLLEGESLLPDRGRHEDYTYISNCSGELDRETGVVRLTATGRDPYYWLLPKNTTVAPVMVIKYRTESIGVKGKIYASTAGVSERGAFEIPYISDGSWRLLVVDLPLWLSAESYDMDTNLLHHLRYDFINISGDLSGQWVEVEYVAFFYNENDVYAYEEFRQSGAPEEESTEPETATETEEVTQDLLETVPTDDVGNTVGESEPDTAPAGCKAALGTVGALTLAAVLTAAITLRKKSNHEPR